MMVWELTMDDVEAVVNLQGRGLSREEIAKSLGMTVHMVVCAQKKAARRPVKSNLNLFAVR